MTYIYNPGPGLSPGPVRTLFYVISNSNKFKLIYMLSTTCGRAGWAALPKDLPCLEVAGSNLVFRSLNSTRIRGWNFLFTAVFGALVAKLVDAQDLKSCLQQCKCGFKSRLGHRLQPIREGQLFYWVKHRSNIYGKL